MSNHRSQKRRGGRYTPRMSRSAVLAMARAQAELHGCTCEWELGKVDHSYGFTYAQVKHDHDCPAINRRDIGLSWPAGGAHG